MRPVWAILLLLPFLSSAAMADLPELTLREALGMVLQRHPEAQAARAHAEAAGALARGAGAQPNPELRLAAVSGAASEDSNRVLQRLEISGQPRLRGEVAEAEAAAAGAELRGVERRLAGEAAAGWLALWSARERRRVGEARLELAGELGRVSRRRLELGEISRSAHMRVELEVSRAGADTAAARLDEETAALRLGTLLGLPGPARLPEAPDLPAGETPALEGLLERAAARPEVAEAEARARAAALEADLAAKTSSPVVEMSAYRSHWGANPEQGMQVAVVAPLWDWGTLGAEAERRRGEAQAAALLAEARLQRVRLEIQEAWGRLRVLERRREALRAQAATALELSRLARRGYEAGLFGLQDALDGQRTWLEIRLEEVAAEAAWQAGWLELQWAAGAPPALEEEKP